MDKQLSKKFLNINILCMVLVVVLHAQNVSTRVNGFVAPDWDFYMQHFISEGIGNITVPLFFCISGFFFFDRLPMAKAAFSEKIKKRVKTILVPYILVSLYAILLVLTIQTIPFTAKYFNNGAVRDWDLFTWFKTWFLTPINYPLWFLRNLFCIVLLSPLVYLYLRTFKAAGVIVMGIIWCFCAYLLPFSIVPTIFFFMLGGYLKIYLFEKLEAESKIPLIPVYIVWFGLLAIYFIFYNYPEYKYAISVIMNVSILTGFLAVWRTFDTGTVKRFMDKPVIEFLKGFSFIIFLFHEPLLTMYIKIMFAILGKTALTSVITYFSAPVVIVAVCVLIGYILKKYLNPVYRILTGGR